VLVTARGFKEVWSHDARPDDFWGSVMAAFALAHGLATNKSCWFWFWVSFFPSLAA
jgi:hypothetical protein